MHGSLCIRLSAVLLGLLLALPAAAQWAWRDVNGRVVYSDRAPPSDVKPDQIVRQPAQPGVLSAPLPSTQGERPAAAAPKTLAERELESRKRQQEQAEAAKLAADEQARKQQLAQECTRARGYLRALEDGIRVTRTDAQGNREFLEDSQRASEIQRTRDQISRMCE
jgi:hypothetical protein